MPAKNNGIGRRHGVAGVAAVSAPAETHGALHRAAVDPCWDPAWPFSPGCAESRVRVEQAKQVSVRVLECAFQPEGGAGWTERENGPRLSVTASCGFSLLVFGHHSRRLEPRPGLSRTGGEAQHGNIGLLSGGMAWYLGQSAEDKCKGMEETCVVGRETAVQELAKNLSANLALILASRVWLKGAAPWRRTVVPPPFALLCSRCVAHTGRSGLYASSPLAATENPFGLVHSARFRLWLRVAHPRIRGVVPRRRITGLPGAHDGEDQAYDRPPSQGSRHLTLDFVTGVPRFGLWAFWAIFGRHQQSAVLSRILRKVVSLASVGRN